MKENSEKIKKHRSNGLLRLQLTITTGAILITIAHLIWPTLSIDAITVFLLFIALLPWVAPLIKSLEFPGGWKVEFQDIQSVKQKAEEAGLLEVEKKVPDLERTYIQISDQDPNLALAGLRIEIEKRLLQIATSHDLFVERASVSKLLRILGDRGILTKEERIVLSDLIHILNSAVHGANVDRETAEFAIEMGTRLLDGLDERIQINEKN